MVPSNFFNAAVESLSKNLAAAPALLDAKLARIFPQIILEAEKDGSIADLVHDAG